MIPVLVVKHSKRIDVLLLLVALPLALVSCRAQPDDGAPRTPSTWSTPTSSTPPTTTEENNAEPSQEDAAPHPGYTCPDWHIHEPGTTLYNDGTHGYTDDCYAQMTDDMLKDGADPNTISTYNPDE